MTRPCAAPGPIARQDALAARASALDSSGAHYALYHLAFGAEADQAACAGALAAAEAYQAELAAARAELRAEGGPRAGPGDAKAAALPGAAAQTPAAATRAEPSVSSLDGGGDRPGAPR